MLPELRHTQLWTWLERSIPAQQRANQHLDILKATLLAHGVNSRGWRLYLDYGDAIFDKLGKPWVAEDWLYTSGANAVAFLCLLQACEMDVLPPATLVRSMPQWQIPENRLRHVPPGFFRAAWKMCTVGEYTGTPIESLVEARIVPVCQWYFDTQQHEKPDANLLKAGWAALEARYLECVRDKKAREAVRADSGGRQAEWVTPVHSAEMDQYCFTALHNSAELKEEGQKMAHCIGSYAARCRHSSLRAFSVRSQKSGERIATLTVFYSPQSRNWQMDQIHGPSNSQVAEQVIVSSLRLLDCLDEATGADKNLLLAISQLRPAQQKSCITFW